MDTEGVTPTLESNALKQSDTSSPQNLVTTKLQKISHMVQVDAESENRVSANSLIPNCIYIWMRRESILPSFVITNWSFWQKNLRNVGSCVCETMKW